MSDVLGPRRLMVTEVGAPARRAEGAQLLGYLEGVSHTKGFRCPLPTTFVIVTGDWLRADITLRALSTIGIEGPVTICFDPSGVVAPAIGEKKAEP